MFLLRWLNRLFWLVFVIILIESFIIIGYAKLPVKYPQDAAIVLGAAVAYGKVTPVFQARIDHAIDLYKAEKVSHLIFTGGVGYGDELAESEVARSYALSKGVPEKAILLEIWSRSTWQNLFQAQKLMQAHGFKSAVLVSDPLHLYRASLMAAELELDVQPAATPYSRYVSWKTWGEFLMRELYFINHYWLDKLRNFVGASEAQPAFELRSH